LNPDDTADRKNNESPAIRVQKWAELKGSVNLEMFHNGRTGRRRLGSAEFKLEDLLNERRQGSTDEGEKLLTDETGPLQPQCFLLNLTVTASDGTVWA
jgi:hypothetical protein